MDGLVSELSSGDKKLFIGAGIKSPLFISVAVTQAMWTDDRPS